MREFLDQHVRWLSPNGHGIEWRKAHCSLPGHEHDDAKPSLSVSYTRNLFKCHTPTCVSYDLPSAERTLAKLQQLMEPNNGTNGQATPTGTEPQPERRIDITRGRRAGSITAVYDYQDEHGNLRYRKLRHPHPTRGKTFSFCRPPAAGDRDQRWIVGLGHQPHHLYGLPKLLKDPGKVVFVTEGEKNARHVRKLGLPATTLDSGAGANWTHVASDIARLKAAGKTHVILLQDNDPAGKVYVDHGAAAWLKAGFSKAKRVLLSNLPEKGDVSDWIARLERRLRTAGVPRAKWRRIIPAALLKGVTPARWMTKADLPPAMLTVWDKAATLGQLMRHTQGTIAWVEPKMLAAGQSPRSTRLGALGSRR